MPNLQQRIVVLLKDFPATVQAGQPFDNYLEQLADDIQAEVIKGLNLHGHILRSKQSAQLVAAPEMYRHWKRLWKHCITRSGMSVIALNIAPVVN